MTTHPPKAKTRASALALTVALALLATGCTQSTQAETTSPSHTDHHENASVADSDTSSAMETATLQARIALTYDGGIKILDATTLEQVADLPTTGFARLNELGDDRTLAVSVPGGFAALDMGTWAQVHGDHSHYFAQEPILSEVFLAAAEPGHVIAHGDSVSFYDDATGSSTTYGIAGFTTDSAGTNYTAAAPHHGFVLPRNDGTLVTTEGNSETRSTVMIVDSDGKALASTDNCPGVHGEAVAEDELVTVGCEDGVLIIDGTTITKVASPTEYGRIGTQKGSEDSELVLGDYKKDKDAENEIQTEISLIDAAKHTIDTVALPAAYTFRSLARDEDGTPVVLATDGSLHVIDMDKREVSKSIPVVAAWEVPAEWQEPRPAAYPLNGSIYVTSPAEKKIYAVDVETGKVWNEATLDVVPNEISGTLGGHSESDHNHAQEDTSEADEHEHSDDENSDHHEHEGGEGHDH